jgi:hypothetical protein
MLDHHNQSNCGRTGESLPRFNRCRSPCSRTGNSYGYCGCQDVQHHVVKISHHWMHRLVDSQLSGTGYSRSLFGRPSLKQGWHSLAAFCQANLPRKLKPTFSWRHSIHQVRHTPYEAGTQIGLECSCRHDEVGARVGDEDDALGDVRGRRLTRRSFLYGTSPAPSEDYPGSTL